MADNTRSQDYRRLEEFVKETLKELTSRLQVQDDNISALNLQNGQIMAQLRGEQGSVQQPGGGHGVGAPGRGQYLATRQTKVDFPRFNGEDLSGWLYRCHQFFEVDGTPPETMVKLASINVEGRALQWQQNWVKYKKGSGSVSWEEYVLALEERFGDHSKGDPMSELLNLKQAGTVSQYHDQFEFLLGRVDLSEDYAISFFLSGLKPVIQHQVKMFMPKTLNQAYTLAQLQETSLKTLQQELHFSSKKPPLLSYPSIQPKFPQNPTVKPITNTSDISKPFQRTPRTFNNSRMRSSSEFDEKRAKGLCFWCDEKYEAGHRCKQRQLYVVEVQEESDDESGNEKAEKEEEEVKPHISVHAINGIVSKGYKTMRVTGHVNKRDLHILIDSGSTHNFLDVEVAKKVGCMLTSINPMRVDVADGNSLSCISACKGLNWTLQGTKFQTDVLLLPLGNCDMVLGVQWLETLGEIKWDFKQLRMEFVIEGKKHVLRGSFAKAKLKTISSRGVQKLISQGSECSMVQLCSLQLRGAPDLHCFSNGIKVIKEDSIHEAVQELLEQYEHLFKEPTGLPPHRTHDHKIPLKEGTSAVNVRPYRHSSFQKDVVEKMTNELLGTGLIQCSNSSSSSLVVLVKKKDGTWRMCIDFRELNKNTVKDKYPIPIIEELLDELHGSILFSKMDQRAGYHQIRMYPPDVHKTAFRTHDGHYEFLVMPFGLTNAPATFQSLMNDIFRPFLRKFILVFFDDILIYSKTLEDHVRHLKCTFQLLHQHSLLAKRSKCYFAQSSVEYLGHIISAQGVATDPQEA